MLTTQIQVLLYIGNIQLVSCSLFVPVPDIVVKSHQTLEAILPYLPLSLTAVPEQLELEQEQQQQLLQAPPSSSSSASSNSSQESQALVLSSRPTGETPLSLKSRHRLSRSTGAESGSGHQGHSHSGGSNTNRISPDSSIPATTCIKISLHPTPTFKFFTYPIPDAASSPTELIQVTGSFNAWQRTEPLARNQATAHFEIEVPMNLDSLPADNKILYKFVLDGSTWVTDPAQQVERDFAGNLNNVLVLDRSNNNNDNKHADTPDATTQQHRQQEQEQEQDQDQEQDQSSSYDEQEQHSEETEEERIARVKQEDEDDRVIRELGGGLWGTPFFAVNDPVDLPEHFVAGSDQDVDNLVAEAQVSEVPAEIADITPVEAVIVAEKTLPAEATQVHPEAPVVAEVKNEKEALVQEDEDEDDKIIRQLGGGLWGTPYFQMNDPVALPEHFVEALDADTSSQVPESASVPATSQDQDQKEEESGVETLVVKDAVPEGPEVESASLHILTTAIRPIKRGESFIVEQSPEVDVEPHSQDKVVAHGPVDPLPATPLSVAASFTPSGLTDSHTTSLASSTQPSSINGDNDNDSVVLLTGQLMATAVGDAKPTVAGASESLDTDENVEVATPRISTGTTDADTQTSTTTDKGEKRKSQLWKKIKKALN
ncbi:hypothetical protein BGZ99_009662 [Dissophora globulifera]|uniref:AMP-activated protein kinase glycogen-binding domain-containing protein n=1 Tax=Dissophora globulifera TaxID=979702 RepID=A0A9P6R8R0_9FUNG|nr:hypothetical protein BGZ99_009662 [Dissophora globulifera]